MHVGPALRSCGTSSDESGGEGGGRPGQGRGRCREGCPKQSSRATRARGLSGLSTRIHSLPGQSSRACRGRPSGQRSCRRRHAKTGCDGGSNSSGVGGRGWRISGVRAREDRVFSTRGVGACAGCGVSHQQGRGGFAGGLAGGARRDAGFLTGGAGHRFLAGSRVGGRHLRPGGAREGREGVDLGGGRRGRNCHGGWPAGGGGLPAGGWWLGWGGRREGNPSLIPC